MIPELNKYIETRYERWHDKSKYHCDKVGMKDESYDVINEILEVLLKKDESILLKLLNTKGCKKDQDLRELDFYILQSIKLNCYSKTAPYHAKYKPIPRDETVTIAELQQIEDVEYIDIDNSDIILKQFYQVQEAFLALNISSKSRSIFTHKFINGELLSTFDSDETIKQKRIIYKNVIARIRTKIKKMQKQKANKKVKTTNILYFKQ